MERPRVVGEAISLTIVVMLRLQHCRWHLRWHRRSAVPAIIAQGFFQRKIDTYAARLEVLLTKLAHVCERSPKLTPNALGGKPDRPDAV